MAPNRLKIVKNRFKMAFLALNEPILRPQRFRHFSYGVHIGISRFLASSSSFTRGQPIKNLVWPLSMRVQDHFETPVLAPLLFANFSFCLLLFYKSSDSSLEEPSEQVVRNHICCRVSHANGQFVGGSDVAEIFCASLTFCVPPPYLPLVLE